MRCHVCGAAMKELVTNLPFKVTDRAIVNGKMAFDCVEFQHRAGAALTRRLRGKSVREQLTYWNKISAQFQRRQRASRKAFAR